jgi:serine protease Do
MAEEPTEVLVVDSEDSPPLLPPTAGSGEADKSPRIAVSLLLVAALIGGLVGGAIVAIATRDTGGSSSVTFAPGTNLKLRGGALDVQGVLAKTEPAVVSIETDGFVRQDGFFGPTVSRVRGAGTGMVLTSDGEILTNNHVIEGAQTIRVSFTGQKEPREADLVGADPVNDVALIKVRNASGLRTVTLGDSASLEVGDDVIAIGNALALVGGNTVTRGIVSALNRSIDDPQESLSHLIQTDAAINAGNSGGPLVNAKGEVVGMNTVVIRGDGSGAPVESIGFAIAIDSIKPLLDRLRSGAPAQGAPFIGVATVTMTPQIKAQLNSSVDHGAVVQDVTPGSPAENAGLRVGDVITEFHGKKIASSRDLLSAVRATQPGDKVSFGYYRGDDKRDGSLTVGSRAVRQ